MGGGFLLCEPFSHSPLGSTWCNLKDWSAGLQSIQIVLWALIPILGLAVNYIRIRVQRARHLKAFLGKIRVIAVESGRLTAVAIVSGNKFVVGGFSGKIYLLSSRRVLRKSSVSAGLIRSLHVMRNREHVLIGSDEGLLFILSLESWKLSQIGAFGSPIYAISESKNQNFILGLGNGIIVRVEIQKSPGQEAFVLKEISRSHDHQSSVFGVLSSEKALVSVGADGRLLIRQGKQQKLSEPVLDINSQALWSAAAIADDRFVVACNDGNLLLTNKSAAIKKLKLHKASIRYIECSPQKKWCVTVGKDRCVYATTTDLSFSALLHTTKDYGYSARFSASGDCVVICDGAGEVTIIEFGKPIDDITSNELMASVK